MLPTPSSPVDAVAAMQGTLWKWTNYISGWQPRWFVLDGGCLSYFLSPNEVHLGSRGSLKVSSCDILVHSTDHQRMDMVMPGGRHIYLRAASMFERQQWLLALGVAKQGVSEPDSVGSKMPHSSGSSSGLQNKMKEVQTNCKLLMSHIASIRTLTSDSSDIDPEMLSGLSSDVGVACDEFLTSLEECMDLALSVQHLTSNLKPLPLKELYAPKKGGGLSPVSKLSGFSERELYPPSPPPPTPSTGMPQPPVPSEGLLQTSLTSKTKALADSDVPVIVRTEGKSLPMHLMMQSDNPAPGTKINTSNQEDGSISQTDSGMAQTDSGTNSGIPEQTLSGSTLTDSGGAQADSGIEQMPKTGSGIAQSDSKHSRSHSTSDCFVTPASSPRLTPPSSPPARDSRSNRVGDRVAAKSADIGRRHETFFSSLPAKFENLELETMDGIPSKQFLECCRAILPFFDTLSATAFAPVKADIGGNIKKLTVKYETDPERFDTLQAIVESELNAGIHNASNSATDSLLWLKRAMEFVQHFIAEVSAGERSLDVAAGKAYSRSLRRYHGWIVRGVFNLAMRAVPYHKDFLKVLGSLGTEEGERQVTADMAAFAASLGEIVLILNQFYHKYNLDPLPYPT